MKKSLLFLCAFLFAFGAGSNAQATLLYDLFSDGGSIVVGDKVFDDWVGISVAGTVGSTVVLNGIDVVGLADQPLNPGLQFDTTGLDLVGNGFFVFQFGFSVATLSGEPLIKDNSLQLVGYSFVGSGGRVSVDDAVYDLANNQLAVENVYADNAAGSFQLFDDEEFSPQAQITVVDTIQLTGGGDNDTVSLGKFEQRFSQVAPVPEPATILLLGSGLIGLAGFRKKFRKR